MDQVLTSLAEFAAELRYRDLPAPVVAAAKLRLLDTVGCAIDAHDCDTARIGQQVAAIAASQEYEGRALGSEKTPAGDDAAFINSCMIRHTGLNAIIPGGHPSDMLGALFAVAPQIQASGEQLITAAVVAYETLIRLKLAAPIRDKGWDQSFGVGVGAAAGLSSLDENSSVPEAYLDPSICPLMAIVKVHADEEIDKEYQSGTYHLRVEAKDKSGKSYEVNIVNPPGHERNPLSPQDLAMKFTRLCERRLGKCRTEVALKLWQNIETEINTKKAFDAVNISNDGGDGRLS